MTPREEGNIERSVGRIEARLELMAEYLKRVDGKLDAADAWRSEVKSRLEKMEDHGVHMDKVAGAFDALQQSIHEGSISAKAYSKGILLGIGIAAGGAGATVATFIKWAWASLVGA